VSGFTRTVSRSVRLQPDTKTDGPGEAGHHYVLLSLPELRNRATIDVIHQHADGAEQRFEISGHVA